MRIWTIFFCMLKSKVFSCLKGYMIHIYKTSNYLLSPWYYHIIIYSWRKGLHSENIFNWNSTFFFLICIPFFFFFDSKLEYAARGALTWRFNGLVLDFSLNSWSHRPIFSSCFHFSHYILPFLSRSMSSSCVFTFRLNFQLSSFLQLYD